MSGMFGADVAQLRALAQQLDRSADRVDGTRTSVGHAVAAAPWRGPSADRFRQQWAGGHTGQLTDAARVLRDAAASLRANANQQEQASAADGGDIARGGGAAGGGPTAAAGSTDVTPDQAARYESVLQLIQLGAQAHGDISDLGDLRAALASGSLDLKSFSQWASDVKGLHAGAILDLAGMGVSAHDLGVALGNDDPAGQLQASLELIAGGAGTVVPAVGVAYDAGTFLGDSGYNVVQTFYDTPGGVLDALAQHVYGDDTTFSSLSPDQQKVISDSYSGWEGLLATPAALTDAAARDFWSWVTTGKTRGPVH